MTEPYDLTAVQAAAEIAAARLAAFELVDSLIKRIAALDQHISAWVRVDGEAAYAEAQALDAESHEGRSRGPLHGVPVGFKDIYFTRGLETEAGSPLHRGFVPERDAVTVARLRAAGAIILGKTETTQFAMGDPAPTRNPWNFEHTPGGSSSGSAAAVAARMVPATLGTQTAGSVLRPASFCGVVGFKPSAGRYSLDGIFPLAWTLDHPGSLSRTVADARLLFSVLDERAETPSTGASRPPRIGLLRGRFIDQADAGTVEAIEQAAQTLKSAGADLHEVRLEDDFDLAVDVHHVIMASEAAGFHGPKHRAHPDAYRPILRALIETGALVPAQVYLQAQRLRSELRSRALMLFEGVDCLAMPSALGTAPAGLGSTGNPIFNAPWSLFGFPAVSIPNGLSADGLPYGLQLIGPPLADLALLGAAEWCEQSLPSLPPPLTLQPADPV
jgi:Asp-tRNA(Asn)/Glu-tRNA(Gln) amidotransferase A subunit family amidase